MSHRDRGVAGRDGGLFPDAVDADRPERTAHLRGASHGQGDGAVESSIAAFLDARGFDRTELCRSGGS
jgi:hypothetical protein